MPTITVDIDPRVFNPIYLPYLSSRSRYEVFYGGAGSGKSHFIAQRLVVRHLAEPGHKTLVVRKVGKTSRHSTFALIRQIIAEWGVAHLFDIHRGDLEITNTVNKNQFLFLGLDDVEKLKSIAGITDIWVEEASEITEADFNQLDLRLRGPTRRPKQITLSFNPISNLHWLKRRFFDRANPRTVTLQTTYKDNRFIDAEYAAVIEGLKTIDPVYYQVYGLGEWGVLGNLIFSNYVVEDFDPNPGRFDSVHQGLDFGFNHPSAFLSVGLLDGELYALDELYVRGLTNDELIEASAGQFDKKRRTTADSAEPARIKAWNQAGWNVAPAVKGQDSVRHGIDWLKAHRIHVHAKRCPNLASEIQGYKWREDKDGNVLDEPVAFHDDAIAALRYAMEPLMGSMPGWLDFARQEMERVKAERENAARAAGR